MDSNYVKSNLFDLCRFYVFKQTDQFFDRETFRNMISLYDNTRSVSITKWTDLTEIPDINRDISNLDQIEFETWKTTYNKEDKYIKLEKENDMLFKLIKSLLQEINPILYATEENQKNWILDHV